MSSETKTRAATMEKIVALSKRRGFVFPGSDIYGGLANTWDYGPLGVELKNNIKRLWWQTFVHKRADMVGLDAGILMHPKVWEASGHVANFADPLVDCKTCKSRFRADHLIEQKLGIDDADGKSPEELSEILRKANLNCPVCGNKTLTDARQFNMMFKTTIGPVSETGLEVYLRPETAQGIFVDYKNIMASSRVKVPFGVGQIGKAFRNEITPGNFIFRVLELEQMEIEYFIPEEEWETYFETWLAAMAEWIDSIGIDRSRIRVREHASEKLSHYSKRTADYEYFFPGSIGWGELYGLAYRTDFDLRSHAEASGVDLSYFDQTNNRRYIPHVIEPTFGVERTFLTPTTRKRRSMSTASRTFASSCDSTPNLRHTRRRSCHWRRNPNSPISPANSSRRSRRKPARWSNTMRQETSVSATGGKTRSGRRSVSRLISTP
jgi:glycyl-tRNA synthetase